MRSRWAYPVWRVESSGSSEPHLKIKSDCYRILRVLCANLRLSSEIDFRWLAKSTPGYVGADLTSLTTEAGVIAVKRIFEDIGSGKLVLPEPDGLEQMILDDTPFSTLPADILSTPIARFLLSHPSPLTSDQLSTLSLTPDDFNLALKIVQPSAKREGFATIPDVSWDDIGALGMVRDELHMAIVQPIRHPEMFSVVGIDAPSGVLLWGPPGCGKTLLAKAVANESRANFISVKGPELLNKVSRYSSIGSIVYVSSTSERVRKL
jgi:ribosome biogenesis ATPase